MSKEEVKRSELVASGLTAMGIILAFALLYLTKLYSYLLFHGLVEMFSVVVAFSVFAIAFNSRRFHDNSFLLFLGASYLGVSLLHLLHTLAYKGMGVFTTFDANLSAQLWIAARYLESLALLIAPFLLILRCPMRRILLGISFVTAALLALIFARVFPICYIEGAGLTSFKKISEYLVCVVMLGAIWVAWRYRAKFEKDTFRLYIAAIAVGILAEIPFTLYVGVYDLPNLVGHYLKLMSFYLLYRAVVVTGLSRPQELLFRDLAQREQALQKANEELKAQFAERQRAERSFRELFQHMSNGVLIVQAVDGGQDFYIEDVNGAIERIEDAKRADLVGRRLSEFSSSNAPSPIRALAQQVWKTGQEAYVPEIIGARATGGQRWREVWAYRLPDGQVVMVYNDITERKETEKRLREQDILAAIGQLAAGTAHEINNRLAAMIGLAELMQMSPQLPEESRNDVQTIIQEGERGAKLIQQLLDFSRKSLSSQRIWNMRELLREIAQSLAQEKSVRLESLDLVSGWQVKLDKTQVQRAIENLIRNAREAMPAGGEVQVRLAPLTVTATESPPAPEMPPGRYLAVSVSDRGSGIPAETRAHLFEPFFTTKERALHPGLGLPQVYGIVKEHGGYLAVQGREGGGTTVAFYLPAL